MLTSLDLRKLRCLDGLHYSFQLLKLSYEPMWSHCIAIGSDHSMVAPALQSCWGFIDSLHRVREIAQGIPGLSSKHHEMRVFLSATELTENYRHYIQHIRNELGNEPQNTFPLWGALSWVDQNDESTCHTAMIGARLAGMSYGSCILDTVNRCWVSKVCLSTAEHSYNFDPMYVSAMRFKDFVIPYLVDGAAPEVEFHDKLSISTATFQFIEKPA